MIGRSRVKGGSSANGEQSWRELAGSGRGKLNSAQAKRRRLNNLMRIAFICMSLCGLVAGAIYGVKFLKNREKPIQISTPSLQIENLMFETNGVLSNRWLSQSIGLNSGTTMMEADIQSIRDKLLLEPQVKSAAVERVFPSSLKITIEEHVPALRLAVQNDDGGVDVKIVSRGGVIYEGEGYQKSVLDRLPYLLPHLHTSGSYLPLVGIEQVAILLERVRLRNPALFKTWRVVSLEHYSGEAGLPGQIIEVRGTRVDRILFGASMDFDLQIDRLQEIFKYVEQRGDPSIKRVDLSLRGSAAVQFTSGRISSF